ncbi:MAG: sigma-70 family RNA polymerase sigma factor [Planctomycetota bacterium]
MSQVSPLDRLLAEEPFVRTLAQALLAEEADEVVQQTWLRAMKHGGDGVTQPRSWLASIARNVANNLLRDRRRRQARERAARTDELAPSSAELMEREEQRKRLVDAIDALPSQLRTVLLLRYYEGLAPRHIAAKTGLSNDTVRNRIRRALQLLRERLDAGNDGDRRAWMLAMIPIACPTPAQAAPAVAAVPFAAVLTLTLLAGIVAIAVATWALWPPPPATAPTASSAPAGDGSQAAPASAIDDAAAAPATGPTPTVAPAVEAAAIHAAAVEAAAATLPRTGHLEVHVRHSDGSPAADVRLLVHDHAGDQRAPHAEATSNDAGVARFERLPATELWVSSDRGTRPLVTTIEPDACAVREFRLEQGVHVVGVVVDGLGQPVPFASVEGAPLALATLDVQHLCRADADGRFELRDVHTRSVLGARAPGRLPGVMEAVRGRPGSSVRVRLTVGGVAADVRGVVRAPDGSPIAGATVRVGGGRTSGLHMDGNVHPPMPALARTDDAGAFVATGVPRGRLSVAVVARGFAPWFGEVDRAGAADVAVELQPGAVVIGRVELPDGAPAAGAQVEYGRLHAFDYQRTRADRDGRFRLDRLPAGPVEVRAHVQQVGGARRQLQVAIGQPTRCRLRLDGFGRPHAPGPGMHDRAQPGVPALPRPGPESPPAGPRRGSCAIRGYVLGPDGNPIPDAQVVAVRRGARGGHRIERLSEDDGAFDLGPLPPGMWRVDVFAAGLAPISSERFALREGEAIDLGDLDVPAGGRLRIHLPRRLRDHARVVVLPSITELPLPVHHVNDARETDYLPAGTYEVLVSDRGRELARCKATVVVDRVTDVTVR